jgi:hypothetical protein
MSVGSAGSTDPAILELVAVVRNLASRVEHLEGEQARSRATPTLSEERLSTAMAAVKSGTAEIFPGDVLIEPRQDPEIDERYLVVRVSAAGAMDDIVQGYQTWHRRLGVWAPGLESKFRLSVDIKDEEQ